MNGPGGTEHAAGSRRRYRAYVRGQGGYGAIARTGPAANAGGLAASGCGAALAAGASSGRIVKHGTEETF